MKFRKVILSTLAIFAVIILCINFYKGSDILNFSSFLSFLQSSPNVGVSYSISDLEIKEKWKIFDELRQFINLLTTPLSILIYVGVSLVNALVYMFYFLRFII